MKTVNVMSWRKTMIRPLPGVKDWEMIADNLSKAGWSWGY
jgi:hypothetical protein